MNSLLSYSPHLTKQTIINLIDRGSRQYFIIDSSGLSHEKLSKKIGNISLQALYKVALLLVIVTLPLFLLADFLYMPFRVTHPLIDCHYQLNSPVFSTYFEQLQDYVNQSIKNSPNLLQIDSSSIDSFEKEVAHFILFVKNAKLSNRNNNLNFHQKLLDELRKLLNQKKSQDPNSPSAQFVQNFSRWIYAGPQLTQEMRDFLKTSVLSFSLRQRFDHLNQSNLCEFLYDLHQFVMENENKFPGLNEIPRYYDAHRLGDTPSVLFDLRYETHTTKILRTPAVTMDTKRDPIKSLIEAVIVPEFKGFLNTNEQHLYINLMEASVGSEKIRSTAIEQLQIDYPQNFHLIVLDKNSRFYKQKETPDFMDANEFKAIFLQTLFHQDSFFFWPPSLLEKNWETTCEKLIENVYSDYFSDKNTLSIPERQDFIEIAYYSLAEEAIKILQPATCNISCKSSVDRAPSMLAGVYASHQLKKQQVLTTQDCQKISAIAIAPAILMQNRAPFQHRTHRMISALKQISARI